MADRSEFDKLLSEAAEAPSQDTVTVLGVLARTQEKARFVLTLTDGQSFILSVEAVKSAKSMAGNVGQKLVQLELDAKHLPEKMKEAAANASFAKFPPWDPTIPRFDHSPLPKVKYDEHITNTEVPQAFADPTAQFLYTVPIVDHTVAWVDPHPTLAWVDHKSPIYDYGYGKLPATDLGPTKIVGDPPGGTVQETILQPGNGGYPGFGGVDPGAFAPFIAAMPHQASPATIAALMQAVPYAGATHTIWYADRPKFPVSDGTIPLRYPPYHSSDY